MGHRRGFRCRLNPKCVEKHEYIVKELDKGAEKANIAKKLKVSKGTLYRYMVYTGLFTPEKCNQRGWIEHGVYH